MGGDQVYIEIIVFAAIAAFLVYRLRSVLGRKHGEERQRPDVFNAPEPAEVGADAGVGPLARRSVSVPMYQPGEHRPLVAWLEAIVAADPNFNEKAFLAGARSAFTMIVEAFARGDRAALRPLLSDAIYANFDSAIRQREDAGEVMTTTIVAFRDVDITAARLDDAVASITVTFQTLQSTVIHPKDAAMESEAADPEDVIDIWTFTRDTRSADPNWMLVETRSP